MNRRVSPVIARWRTGLSRPVLILQAGNAVNYFGYGLVLPFEISAVATPPSGALLDRYSGKALVVAGTLASAVG